MIPWLPEECVFPPLEKALADPNGLLAAGGDLEPAATDCGLPTRHLSLVLG
jgi:hypothetical protein